jgi:NOL1/NOP2/fmu family ribosome biogenesis protein
MAKTVLVKVIDLAPDAAKVAVEVDGVRVSQWMNVGDEVELPVSKNVTLEIQSGSGKMFGGFK